MTARAKKDTIKYIVSSLQMQSPFQLIHTPERVNIRYVVQIANTGECDTLFIPLIERLREKVYETERTLIFCRTRKGVRDIYQAFESKFGESYS